MMVLSKLLERWLTSRLQPWLRKDAPPPRLHLRIHVFNCELVYEDVEFDALVLNETFMTSSPLLIRSAKLQTLRLSIHPWRNPVFSLEVRGVCLVIYRRSSEDVFWERGHPVKNNRQYQPTALQNLDPQGTALGAFVEGWAIKETSSYFKTLSANMILQCTKIQFQDLSCDLFFPAGSSPENLVGLTPVRDLQIHCFRLEQIILKDGFFALNWPCGGLLFALIFSILFTFCGCEGYKICSIQGFSFDLTNFPTHLTSTGTGSKHIVYLRETIVLVKLKSCELLSWGLKVPEIIVNICPRDITQLLAVHSYLFSINTTDSSSQPYHKEERSNLKSHKDLWLKVRKMIRKTALRRRLQSLLESVTLLVKYFHAYESWLKEVGWGCHPSITFKTPQVKRKMIPSRSLDLWKTLCEMEHLLPVDAVVSARRVARHRVWAERKEHIQKRLSKNTRKQKGFCCSIIGYLSSFFWKLWHLVQSFCALTLQIYVALQKLFDYISSFICKQHIDQSADNNNGNAFINQGKGFSKYSLPHFSAKIYKVSVNVDSDIEDGPSIGHEIENISLSSIAGLYLFFSFENIWLEYGSEVGSMQLSFACGEVNGEVLKHTSVKYFGLKSKITNSKRLSYDTMKNENILFQEKIGRRKFLKSIPAFQTEYLFEHASRCSSWNGIVKDHQRHLWSEWKLRFSKHNKRMLSTQPEFEWEPTILFELGMSVIDPFLRNPNSGLCDCGLSVGELVFDLDVASTLFIIVLSVNFVKSIRLNSRTGISHPTFCVVKSAVEVDRKSESILDMYFMKMKHTMLAVVPENYIHLSAFIKGPRFKLSLPPTEAILFDNNTETLGEHSNVLFEADLGFVEAVVWPKNLREVSGYATQLDLFQKSDWINNLCDLHASMQCTSFSYVPHEQVENNIFLRFGNISIQLTKEVENQKLLMMNPFSFSFESSVCRHRCGTLLSIENVVLASLDCFSSPISIICYLDELCFFIKGLEGQLQILLDACFNSSSGLPKNSDVSNEPFVAAEILSFDDQRTTAMLKSSSFMMATLTENSPAKFSFFLTCIVESFSLIFKMDKKNNMSNLLTESGSRNSNSIDLEMDKHKGTDPGKICSFPMIDLCVSFQNFTIEHFLEHTKNAKFRATMSAFNFLVCDGRVGNSMPCSYHVCTSQRCYGFNRKEFAELKVNAVTLSSTCYANCSSQLQNWCDSQGHCRSLLDKVSLCLEKGTSMDMLSSLSWLVMDLDLSDAFIVACPLEGLISKAVQKSSGSKRMHLSFIADINFQSVSGVIQGGFFVIETKALASVLNVSQLLFGYDTSLPMASEGKGIIKEDNSDHAASYEQKSISLRAGSLTDDIELNFHENRPEVNNSLKGSFSFTVQQFTLIMAFVNESDEEHAILFESDFKAYTEVGCENENFSFDISRFLILGLHQVRKSRKGKEKAAQSPHFTAALSPFLQPEGSEAMNGFPKRFPGMNFSDRVICDISGNKYTRAEYYEEESTSKSCDFDEDHSSILDCMKLSVRLERNFSELEHGSCKFWDAWSGQCSISGVHLKLTTSEILILVSLVSPLSHILKGSNSSSHMKEAAQSDQSETCKFMVPNGAIVAIKDVEEQLYLTVDQFNTNYILNGVLHYSLAGDKALFKVKYQDAAEAGKKQPWFSLLSLSAINDKRESYRLHYQATARVVGISSTNDRAEEHWQLIPYKYIPEDDREELEVYRHECKKWIHLINRKSNSSFSFVNGAPVLVKQPGNPLKIKLFSCSKLLKDLSVRASLLPNRNAIINMDCSEDEQVAKDSSVLPKVIVKTEKMLLTVLYEAPGKIHFLPLIQASVDTTGTVVQFSSCKFRLISDINFTILCYASQRNMWVELLKQADISVVYSIRFPFLGKKPMAPEKAHTSFYSYTRKIDIYVNEMCLDTCLFLVGELKFSGPYNIKKSPVRANSCKIVNCTGSELLCFFDDNVATKIQAYKTDSFLIRHMLSRSYLRVQSATLVGLQLIKSGKGSSEPIFVSLEEVGTTTARTRILSENGTKKAPGPILVADVTKDSEDGLMVVVSPMVRIQNATGLTLELRSQRPQQTADGAVIVCLRDGETIDDSIGAFDALDFSGERMKALRSLGLGHYRICLKPTDLEISSNENRRLPSFEWSDDIQSEKPVRLSGLFEKLGFQIKAAINNQASITNFSIIHCKRNGCGMRSPGMHFLVRTIKRKISVTKHSSSGNLVRQSPVVALKEQVEILILPTIHVSNLLDTRIHVAATNDLEAATGSKLEASSFHSVIESGNKVYMYANLSKLFLNITLCSTNQRSAPVSADQCEKIFEKSKGELHVLDVRLNFNEQKSHAMLRMCRGDTGLLEVIVYASYELHNDTEIPFVCSSFVPKRSFPWRGNLKKMNITANNVILPAKSRISWFENSEKIWIQRLESNAVGSSLDLNDLSGFAEITLAVQEDSGEKDIVKLGVSSQLSTSKHLEPTHRVHLVGRHIVINKSSEDIVVCQYGMQETPGAVLVLRPGQQTMLKMKIWPENEGYAFPQKNALAMHGTSESGSLFLLQFSMKESGWTWSGPICAASLGRFFLKMKSYTPFSRCDPLNSNDHESCQTNFAVVDTEEEKGSLIMHFCLRQPEYFPYYIVNSLQAASITFCQKEKSEIEILQPGASVGYVWDDLTAARLLVIQVAGTQFSRELSLDKLTQPKPFYKSRQSSRFGLAFSSRDMWNDGLKGVDLSNMVYEVYADGPTRVLKISEVSDGYQKKKHTTLQIPHAKVRTKISVITMSLLEEENQWRVIEQSNTYMIIVLAKTRGLKLEFTASTKYAVVTFNVQGLELDKKWQGAPNLAMLRVQPQDIFEGAENVLHMLLIFSTNVSNETQVKFLSLFLQAINLHLDEDTLMKLVPFYRTSLSVSNAAQAQVYFEHFEIHPIKIIMSFRSGNQQIMYTSAQETLRAFLHSIIKLPEIKGATIELNGVILSHALVTFRELAVKCAQHYSWYVMKSIYAAKGSQMLPPAFASLFDDSASATFDYFFDPSIAVRDVAKGMFSLLRKNVQKKGYFGTHRTIEGVGNTVKKAGFNVLFVAIREVSDDVLKGAEMSGFNGMVNGFRRGILKLAMEPSLLRTALIKGSSNRRIKLDRNAGMDEMYIEGYLQAMLDTLFKQEYLRVKVIDDQVLLKNLPPNSSLINEILEHVNNFLIGEGLLVGEPSAAAHSLKNRHRDLEWQLGPRIRALSEQLFVIFAIRTLRKQADNLFCINGKRSSSEAAQHEYSDSSMRESTNEKTNDKDNKQEVKQTRSLQQVFTGFLISSVVAYIDGRLCRHISNAIIRRIVSGFLLSFVEQN